MLTISRSLNLIGTGKVAEALTPLLLATGEIKIAGVCARSTSSAERMVAMLGQGRAVETPDRLPPADLTLVAVSDDQIEAVAKALDSSSAVREGSVIFHCSGCKDASVFDAFRARGASSASVHPLRSFADPKISQECFAGTYCAIEGDAQAIAILEPLFTRLGARVFAIATVQKARYHAAAVMASNFLVTLFEQSQAQFKKAGLDDELACDVSLSLMKQTLQNVVKSRSAPAALTGPLKRADIATLRAHVAALDEPLTLALYRALSMATLPIAALTPAQKEEVTTTLGNG